MNKIKKMLCAACTLVLISVSNVANADSSNFAGPYVGLQVLGLGAEFAGTSNSSAGTYLVDDSSNSTGWGTYSGYFTYEVFQNSNDVPSGYSSKSVTIGSNNVHSESN